MGPSSLSFTILLLLGTSTASLSDYAPTLTACPDTSLTRTFTATSQALNPSESDFVAAREGSVIPQNWQTWLGNGSDIGYNTTAFTSFARVGLAFSGGGYRASQFGAGVISAFDGRNATAVAAGTGGLLQVATYFGGLSGGSWLTAGLYMNDFPMAQDMVLGSQPGWLLQEDLLDPDVLDTVQYYSAIDQSVDAKAQAGFNVTIADGWARALSYHFLSGTNLSNFFDTSSHGAGQLWSQIANAEFFTSHQAPFPLVVLDTNGTFDITTEAIPLDLSVYEVSPFEFASFDPDISAAAELSYIGTSLLGGVPVDNTSCVTGFDQAGFVIGTSSNIFASLLGTEAGDAEISLVQTLLGEPVESLSPANAAVSKWPNPFRGLAPSFVDSDDEELELIDGGSNGENIPLNPLLVKAREVDVIVAVDGSADTDDNWPNGVSLLFSAERLSTILGDTHQQLPELPSSTDDFVDQGLNQRPTFFGCNSTDTPLIIYVPNSPPLTGDAPYTNAPTTQLQFEVNETQNILDQAYANTIGGFVPNANTPDPNWGRCLQCAAVDRSRSKASPTIERSAFCATCFSQYCYDPSNLSSSSELPNRKLTYAGPAASLSL
ncbi:phospholipase B [Lentinula raphanica]|uniref:Lysophospholipase n=1 Tax=Lentinula raphanica TaxID=153919 RepID=A0AA38PBL5_9AGAR|nr:lysophospholipase [Lentinula raphanica]KAJ3819973.1 phospholipase B [Lentinula raphanica]KAJ3839668.1 phospholipase B [Lentinula raphanica]KAJ3965354.1 phospholipase B [Lentinula raphanica]